MEVEAARTYLRESPTVVKEGLDEKTAERIAEILASKKGLFLVEPMEVDPSAETGEEPEPLQGPPDAHKAQTPAERAEQGNKIVLAVLAAAALVLALVIFKGFITSALKAKSESRPPVPAERPADENPEDTPPPQATYDPEKAAQTVRERIAELQFKQDDLNVRLEAVDGYLRQHPMASGADRNEYDSRTREAAELRRQLALMVRDLARLKTGLKKLTGTDE
jgi:hypothetical protein